MSGDVLKIDEILRDLESGGIPESEVIKIDLQSVAQQQIEEQLRWRPPPPLPKFPHSIKHIEPDIEQGESFYCQICMDNNAIGSEHKLSQCQHIFCKECIANFLKSKILDGQVYPKCFYISKTPIPEKENEFEETTCTKPIDTVDIEAIFHDDSTTLEKYRKYIYSKENKTARDCPRCNHVQLGTPEVTPVMICTECGLKYCYFHANAHDFNQFPTCEEYEASIAKDTKSTVDFIQSNSKPCPGCGVHVMKTGGCNHMKCQCGAAFCWLCGKQIDDATFPAHFQWWNPAGCANLQMNEAIEPSCTSRFFARLLALGQLIVLGPLTLLSTILSSTLCCCCIYMKYKSDGRAMDSTVFQEMFSTCMSSWGIFWMFLLFVLPLGIALGTLAGSLVVAVVVMIYPCYASYRIAHDQYPWPDSLTNCFRRCFGRFRRSRCLRGCGRLLNWCFCELCGRRSRSPRNQANYNDSIPSPIASESHPNSVRFFRSSNSDSSPEKPIESQPSSRSNGHQFNRLTDENDVLNQMTLLLDLMERVEQLQAEQRKKKELAAANMEVKTPLNDEKGLMIADNTEDDDADLEYEQHRIRLQTIIEQLCNMNSNNNENKKDESNTKNREDEKGTTEATSTSSVVNNSGDDKAPVVSLTVGCRVEVNYRGRGQYYSGQIARDNADEGTFDIDYDDGDKELNVPQDRIRVIAIEDLKNNLIDIDEIILTSNSIEQAIKGDLNR